MDGSLRLGRLFGIPIELHWTFLLVIPLFAWIIGTQILLTTSPAQRGLRGRDRYDPDHRQIHAVPARGRRLARALRGRADPRGRALGGRAPERDEDQLDHALPLRRSLADGGDDPRPADRAPDGGRGPRDLPRPRHHLHRARLRGRRGHPEPGGCRGGRLLPGLPRAPERDPLRVQPAAGLPDGRRARAPGLSRPPDAAAPRDQDRRGRGQGVRRHLRDPRPDRAQPDPGDHRVLHLHRGVAGVERDPVHVPAPGRDPRADHEPRGDDGRPHDAGPPGARTDVRDQAPRVSRDRARRPRGDGHARRYP